MHSFTTDGGLLVTRERGESLTIAVGQLFRAVPDNLSNKTKRKAFGFVGFSICVLFVGFILVLAVQFSVYPR